MCFSAQASFLAATLQGLFSRKTQAIKPEQTLFKSGTGLRYLECCMVHLFFSKDPGIVLFLVFKSSLSEKFLSVFLIFFLILEPKE